MRDRSSFSSTASRVPCRPRTMASPSPPASAPPTPALVNWTCGQRRSQKRRAAGHASQHNTPCTSTEMANATQAVGDVGCAATNQPRGAAKQLLPHAQPTFQSGMSMYTASLSNSRPPTSGGGGRAVWRHSQLKRPPGTRVQEAFRRQLPEFSSERGEQRAPSQTGVPTPPQPLLTAHGRIHEALPLVQAALLLLVGQGAGVVQRRNLPHLRGSK